MWYGSFFFPPAWLQTWIPTLATAFIFWFVLARSPIRRWASRQSAVGLGLSYATICSALSIGVFALCQSLDGLFTHQTKVEPDGSGLMSLMQSTAGHTFLMAVGIVGAAIGAAVYLKEMRGRQS
jgi:ABC-type phosphate transport system permease subunit